MMDVMGELGGSWRRSTKCLSGDCVEVMLLRDGAAVRDSKRPEAGVLRLDAAAWVSFVSAVRSGQFDD